MASSSDFEKNLATVKLVLTTAASVAATVMVAGSMVQDYLPYELRDIFFSRIRSFLSRFSTRMTVVIDESDGFDFNDVYKAAETYLGGKISPSTRRLKVSKPEKEKNLSITVDTNETIFDVFNGAKFKWILICKQVRANEDSRIKVARFFELSFHKKYLDLVLKSYLPHVVNESKSIKQEKRTLKIFTADSDRFYYFRGDIGDAWIPMNLDHPATFKTVALDTEIKKFILEDLERFVSRKEYYRKVGKAWKRGYLLYGPPGTGKSSLIAAMANYLNFDVYDLELTELRENTDLKKLLIAMANRSILVVEDIDCSVDFHDRNMPEDEFDECPNSNRTRKLTLSGLLNFVDGLWSSCGDERIIIFTTNHKEKLDPALLRPGRMDVHIHLSYCTPSGFRVLASNYLGIKEHALFEEIQHQIEATEVTPAEVAEELLKGSDPDIALQGLIEFLTLKKKEKEEAKADKEKEKVELIKKLGGEIKDSAEAEIVVS